MEMLHYEHFVESSICMHYKLPHKDKRQSYETPAWEGAGNLWTGKTASQKPEINKTNKIHCMAILQISIFNDIYVMI